MREIRLICPKCGRSFKTDRARAIDIVQDEGCCDNCGGTLAAVDPRTGGEMGPFEWPDDPDYPREDWKREVISGDTKIGDYEEWLEHQYDAEDADPLAYHDDPDAPLCEVDDCPAPAEPCPCGNAHCPEHPHVEPVVFPVVNRGRGRVVPKVCPRCGATSTGGRYCPRGCGPV